MPDISLSWNATYAHADVLFKNGDLEQDSDLITAVIISLFSDRIASPDFVPNDRTNDRRGWWADTYEGTPIGSRLWQLERGKKTDQTKILLQARDYVREALQWMIDDGVADKVDVPIPQWLSPAAIGIYVSITEPNISIKKTFKFSWAWNQPLQLTVVQPLSSVVQVSVPINPNSDFAAGAFVEETTVQTDNLGSDFAIGATTLGETKTAPPGTLKLGKSKLR